MPNLDLSEKYTRVNTTPPKWGEMQHFELCMFILSPSDCNQHKENLMHFGHSLSLERKKNNVYLAMINDRAVKRIYPRIWKRILDGFINKKDNCGLNITPWYCVKLTDPNHNTKLRRTKQTLEKTKMKQFPTKDLGF